MKADENRRLALHARLIGMSGYRIDPNDRVIYVPYDLVSLDRAATELRDKFKYIIQTEIH